LAEARDKATEARRLLAAGIDPLGQREAARQAEAAKQAPAVTFADAALAYIVAHAPGWRSDKHRAQWRGAIKSHATPLHAMACSAIEPADVFNVLQPIWNTRPETASRLRGRIEMVLSHATARGRHFGPNPAVWRGHQQLLLPKRSKVAPVVHYPALDWREAPAFMAELQKDDGMGAQTLAFAILTAARSGEVRGGR